MEAKSAVILCLTLFCPTISADYVNHSESNGDKDDATEFTVLIVFGVVLAVQILVFLLFACKGYDAVFGSRSRRAGSDSELGDQFPFLPSYDMAISDTRVHPQRTGLFAPNTSIDDGVIVDICRLSVTPDVESQTGAIETNVSVVNTLPNNESTDSGVTVDIGSFSAAPLLRNQRDALGTNCSSVNTRQSYGSFGGNVTADVSGLRVTPATVGQRDSSETDICRLNTPSSLAQLS